MGVTVAAASPDDLERLHRLGDSPVVATLTTDDGTVLRVAAASADRDAVAGPFPTTSGRTAPTA
jgi:hypothetical protein